MFKDEIVQAIYNLAKKKANQHEKYHNNLEIENQRNKKRIIDPPKKEVKIPPHWLSDNKHNPYYVLKHYKQIGNSIFNKLITNSYKPFTPYQHIVNKKDGSKRVTEIFQIPDEAISKYFFDKLLSKNKHRFSSFSYAYRNDRNVHYAINDIGIDIKESSRTYIAEFDFKNFFGSIRHEYLYNQFDKNGFLISNFEKNIIKSFLESTENDRGIPQGTSISLFLANLSCWKLDKKLEKNGLRFARYADDTIIWAESYEKIAKSFDMINDFSMETGVKINPLKSDGISLLSSELKSELASSKKHIDFLGYRISNNVTSIKPYSVSKIKKQISYILYRNLIQPLNGEAPKAVRIPSNNQDTDFLTAIMQVRRYMYGNLSEQKLRTYLNGTYKRLNFKGIMSFYPLVDDEEQLRELDKWLLSTIMNTLEKRRKLLSRWNHPKDDQFPFNISGHDLIRICKNKRVNGKKGLMAIPSFLRIYRGIKNSVITVGIERTMNPDSNDYNY